MKCCTNNIDDVVLWIDKKGIVMCDRLKIMESEGKYHHEDSLLADRYDEFPESPSAYYHHSSRGGGDYWRRVHYEPGDSRAMRIETDYAGTTRKYHSHQHRAPTAEYYEKKKKSHPVREVIMQRSEKPWKDERYNFFCLYLILLKLLHN
jgi:hypothetical protein